MKIGRRLRCSGNPWRILNSACMYQPKHRTHVCSGISSYIDASRWTVITCEVGVDAGPLQLRPRALPEVVEQLRELFGPVQADVLVADEVAERGDRAIRT